MPYSTVANVRIQSPFKDSVAITNAYVTQKIAEADQMIDSVIGGTYVLPLSETPEIIESLSKNIASLLLFKEQNPNIEVAPGISIDEAWKDAMAMLEAIRTRAYKLFDTTGVELPLQTSSLPKFYPNDASSEPDATNTTQPRATMNQEF